MLAQLDRVPGYEPVGRGFESLTPCQNKKSMACPWAFCFASMFGVRPPFKLQATFSLALSRGNLMPTPRRGTSAVRRGSESLTPCQNKKSMASLCSLSGEIGGTKISAENLFSLPICVIMELTKSLPCAKGGGSRRLTEGL